MPAVSQRGGARRRTISEINMVPFIDVMLVLLIIFMVTAPLISTGVVDLPSVGASKTRPQSVVEVIVGSDERLRLKTDGKADPQPVVLTQLAARVRQARRAGGRVGVVDLAAEGAQGHEQPARRHPDLRWGGSEVNTGDRAPARRG